MIAGTTLLNPSTWVGAPVRSLPEGRWLGGQPAALERLLGEGRVVLLHFWTGSSHHCLAQLRHLAAWQVIYGPHGLTTLGIHTPEFAFQADPGVVQAAIDRAELTWPVLHDHDRSAWTTFQGQGWPRILIVAPTGTVAADILGAGREQTIERAIRTALALAGQSGLPVETDLTASEHDQSLCYPTTPTLGFGYRRAAYKNRQRIVRDAPAAYQDTHDRHRVGPALHGPWQVGLESVEASPSPDQYLSVVWAGREAYLVARPASEPARLRVHLQGQPVDAIRRGRDLHLLDNDSVIELVEPRLYELVTSPTYLAPVELRLEPTSGTAQLYSVSFGGCRHRRGPEPPVDEPPQPVVG